MTAGPRKRRRQRCPGCRYLVRAGERQYDARRRPWHQSCAARALGAIPAPIGRPPAYLSPTPPELLPIQRELFIL